MSLSNGYHLPVVGCDDCEFRAECGGMNEQQREMYGCFAYCAASCAEHDWLCPVHRPREFAPRWEQVQFEIRFPLLPRDGRRLPLYVPMLRGHRALLRQTIALPIVAVSTFDLLGVRRGVYGPSDQDGARFRERLRLRPDAAVLFVSVAKDPPLERYWQRRRVDETAASLARLSPHVMTWPNFSFFTDAPPLHRTWNRRRMLRIGAELTEAGISVAPHLNAVSSTDWGHWREVLRDNPAVTIVAKEFATGLRNRERGEAAIVAMAELQQSVGRPLHPLVVGGKQYVARIAREFATFTLVDSTPFVKTMKRQRLEGPSDSPKWIEHPTRRSASLDALLVHNLRAYSDHVAALADRIPQMTFKFAA